MNNELTVGTRVKHLGDSHNMPRTGEIVGVFDTGWISVKWSDGRTDMTPAALFGTARCKVVTEPTAADLPAAIATYIGHLESRKDYWRGRLSTETGRRYVRIVNTDCSGSRFVVAFIDTNGDIYRPHGWNGRAQGVRGNVFKLREVA